jgi:hypothetical protein
MPIPRRLFALLAAVVLWGNAHAVIITNPAALTDYGSFVRDSSSGLDWLKFNASVGLSYNQALAANAGWQAATGAQVQAFESLFGWFFDTPFAGTTVNNGLTDAMAGWLGYTAGNSTSNPRYIWAQHADTDGAGNHWNSYAVHSQDTLTYHDYVTTYNITTAPDVVVGADYGTWLVRQSVPSPQPLSLLLLGLTLAFAARRVPAPARST